MANWIGQGCPVTDHYRRDGQLLNLHEIASWRAQIIGNNAAPERRRLNRLGAKKLEGKSKKILTADEQPTG